MLERQRLLHIENSKFNIRIGFHTLQIFCFLSINEWSIENPTQKLRSDELHQPIQVQVWELWKLAMPKDRSILTDREPI